MKEITTATLKIRGGRDKDRFGKSAGKGALINWDLSMTLGVSQDQVLFVLKEQDADGVHKPGIPSK